MSRTFSLWTLMVVVTLACALAAFAVNFPEQLWGIAVLAALLAPGIGFAEIVSLFSSQRVVTRVIGVVACLFGALIAAREVTTQPSVFYFNPPPLWQLFLDQGVPIVAYSTVAALLAGGFSLFLFPRGKASSEPSVKE